MERIDIFKELVDIEFIAYDIASLKHIKHIELDITYDKYKSVENPFSILKFQTKNQLMWDCCVYESIPEHS